MRLGMRVLSSRGSCRVINLEDRSKRPIAEVPAEADDSPLGNRDHRLETDRLLRGRARARLSGVRDVRSRALAARYLSALRRAARRVLTALHLDDDGGVALDRCRQV